MKGHCERLKRSLQALVTAIDLSAIYHVFVLSFKYATMDCLPTNKITDQDITTFQDDGVICLRNVFSQKWIDVLRRGIEFNRLHPSEMARRKGHTPLFFHDYGNWDSIPEYKEFIFQSPVGEIAGRLLQSSVSPGNYTMGNKLLKVSFVLVKNSS